MDNILTIWEGMEWDRISGQNIIFIKIDFEKAYDCIEWWFILSMLKVLCFRPMFINSISMLFKDASAILNLKTPNRIVLAFFDQLDKVILLLPLSTF